MFDAEDQVPYNKVGYDVVDSAEMKALNLKVDVYKRQPLTVANFVKTARSGFYDGLCWCRIVKDYVIQGGSPDNDIMTDSD